MEGGIGSTDENRPSYFAYLLHTGTDTPFNARTDFLTWRTFKQQISNRHVQDTLAASKATQKISGNREDDEYSCVSINLQLQRQFCILGGEMSKDTRLAPLIPSHWQQRQRMELGVSVRSALWDACDLIVNHQNRDERKRQGRHITAKEEAAK